MEQERITKEDEDVIMREDENFFKNLPCDDLLLIVPQQKGETAIVVPPKKGEIVVPSKKGRTTSVPLKKKGRISNVILPKKGGISTVIPPKNANTNAIFTERENVVAIPENVTSAKDGLPDTTAMIDSSTAASPSHSRRGRGTKAGKRHKPNNFFQFLFHMGDNNYYFGRGRGRDRGRGNESKIRDYGRRREGGEEKREN